MGKGDWARAVSRSSLRFLCPSSSPSLTSLETISIQPFSSRLGLSLTPSVFNSNFNHGVMSSTVRAHRLIMKAHRLGGQRLQLPLLSAIFKAYTCDSKDIGSFDVLGDAAESAGVMSRQEAIEFLKGDELKEDVVKMAEAAKGNGVKGVPLVIIDGRWALSGGQRAEIFVQVGHPSVFSGTCSLNECWGRYLKSWHRLQWTQLHRHSQLP